MKNRRTLRLESLESRELLAGGIASPPRVHGAPIAQVFNQSANPLNISPGATNQVVANLVVSSLSHEHLQPKNFLFIAAEGGEPLSWNLESSRLMADLDLNLANGCETVIGSVQPNAQTDVLAFTALRPTWVRPSQYLHLQVVADFKGFFTGSRIGLELARADFIGIQGAPLPQGNIQRVGLPPTLHRLQQTPVLPPLVVSKNTSYGDQTVLPNSLGVKIGSYVVQNPSTSRSLRITDLTVGLTGTASLYGLSGLRLSVPGAMIPIQPGPLNTFPVNNVLAPGANLVVDVFANTGTQVNVNVVSSLRVAYANAADGIIATTAPAVGQTVTFQVGRLNPPTLVASASTPGQYIPSAGGANNASRATFNFPAVNGSVTITELEFRVVGDPLAVSAIQIGNVTSSPVNGVAFFHGLNLTVPNGGAGRNLDAYVSYALVGDRGLRSGTRAAIGLSYVKYVTGGTTQTLTLNPPVMAPAMTLVGSRPSIFIVLPGSTPGSVLPGLTFGTVRVARLAIFADQQGNIKIDQVPLVFTGNAAGTHINPQTKLVLRDLTGAIIGHILVSNITGNGTSQVSAVLTFTGGYVIPAGQAFISDVEVEVSSLAGASPWDSVSTKLGSPGSFRWTDLAGRGAEGAELGNLILGFPSNSVSIIGSEVFG
ncbi:hypothetical protein KW786_01460 [Candidatus Parcubacteria bacterium]|nr:hypothetical protein [Candidatus Parcubacteria bacterium]